MVYLISDFFPRRLPELHMNIFPLKMFHFFGHISSNHLWVHVFIVRWKTVLCPCHYPDNKVGLKATQWEQRNKLNPFVFSSFLGLYFLLCRNFLKKRLFHSDSPEEKVGGNISVVNRMKTDSLGLSHSTTTNYMGDLEQVNLSVPWFP